MAGRKGDYLFKRKGSQNWWLRFRYPWAVPGTMDKNLVEISLGTPDRTEAELKAVPYIQQHRVKVLHRRMLVEGRFKVGAGEFEYQPGRQHTLEDGSTAIAMEGELLVLNAEGGISERRPNLKVFPFIGFNKEERKEMDAMDASRPKAGAAFKNATDLAILET